MDKDELLAEITQLKHELQDPTTADEPGRQEKQARLDELQTELDALLN